MRKPDPRIVTCNRCGHKWATKIIPLCCSKCKTRYWNKPRIRKLKKRVN